MYLLQKIAGLKKIQFHVQSVDTFSLNHCLKTFKFPCICNCMPRVASKQYKVTTLAVHKMNILCFDKAFLLASFGSPSVQV